MTVDEKVVKAIDLKTLKLPAFPPVLEIGCEDYEDSTGQPSLRFLVVFKRDINENQITGEQVGNIKRAIHDSLLAHGITKFPYIFIATSEELAEAIDEE
ncbi:MAG: hypothetical protein ACKOBW_08930 [Planctomycetota bacterium]